MSITRLLLLLLFLGLPAAHAARPWFILFGSEACDECAEIKEMWEERENEEEQTPPLLIFVNIDQGGNYAFLKQLEKRMQVSRPGNAFPILLLGNRFVAGVDGLLEVADDFADLLEQTPPLPELAPLQQLADHTAATEKMTVWEAPPRGRETTLSAPAGPPPRLLYFLSKGCAKCSRQLRELQQLAATLPELQLDCYDIATTAGQLQLQRARDRFALPDNTANLAPMVVWPDGYVTGRLATSEELTTALRRPLADKPFWDAPFTPKEQRQWRASQDRLLGTATAWMVILAGLLDGLNPCAFATSIFLIGYLLYLKRRPRQIILTGAAFCFGVFLTYLLFGLGLSFLIDFLGRFPWIKAAIYLLFGTAGLALAFLHARDALRYRRRQRASDMDMGLSAQTHRRIHEAIRRWTQVSAWLLLPAAILLGALVSSMELACTGQVYLPTLAAINANGVTPRALLLLLLYNISFIIPLLIVAALAALGVGARALAGWARRHVLATKLTMALLFVILSALMLILGWKEIPRRVTHTAVNCLQTDRAP